MKELSGVLALVVIILCIVFGSRIHKLNAQLVGVQSDNLDCRYNLAEANDMIEDAQWYAWSSYEEMGYALDNLYPVY